MFRPDNFHDSSPVVSGVKYALRSDVLYQPQSYSSSLIASVVVGTLAIAVIGYVKFWKKN